MKLQTKAAILLLIFCFTTVVITYFLGVEQNKVISEDNKTFEVVRSMKTKSTLMEIDLLKGMDKRRPQNYLIQFQLGEAYRESGDFKTAASYYEKAMNIKPTLIANAVFCIRYAETSIMNGDVERAKAYLLQVDHLKKTPEQEALVMELQQELIGGVEN